MITGKIMTTVETKVGSRTGSVDPTMWSPLLTSQRNLANLGGLKTWRIYPVDGIQIHHIWQANAGTSRIILGRVTQPRARVRKTTITRTRRTKETWGFKNLRVLSM
jgi:hypothetical protein